LLPTINSRLLRSNFTQPEALGAAFGQLKVVIDNPRGSQRIDITQVVFLRDARACSQVHCLLHDLVADMTIQFMLGNQFQGPLQQFGKLVRQGQTLREQIVTAWEVHQEIHVTVSPFLSPRHRTEHPHAPRAILMPQACDDFAFTMYLIQKHTGSSTYPRGNPTVDPVYDAMTVASLSMIRLRISFGNGA
jgi:hypothetical protein